MLQMRKHIKFLSENPNSKDRLGDLGIFGKIILKWLSDEQNARIGASDEF
jgi:hypothetical protein